MVVGCGRRCSNGFGYAFLRQRVRRRFALHASQSLHCRLPLRRQRRLHLRPPPPSKRDQRGIAVTIIPFSVFWLSRFMFHVCALFRDHHFVLGGGMMDKSLFHWIWKRVWCLWSVVGEDGNVIFLVRIEIDGVMRLGGSGAWILKWVWFVFCLLISSDDKKFCFWAI